MSALRVTHHIDRQIATLAEAHHGIVTRADLRALGLNDDQILWRVRTGRLHRLHAGVYAVGDRLIPREGHWLAAVRFGGPEALLSHRTSSALRGLLGEYGPIHVTVPPDSGVRSRGKVKVHRANVSTEERDSCRGIPVVSVARTMLDLAATEHPDLLRRALQQAEYLRLFDLHSMQAVLRDHPGERGVRKLGAALAGYVSIEGTRSEFERRFLVMCAKYGLPRPARNTDVLGHEVDFLWEVERVIVETDGWGAHGTRSAFEHDHQRDLELGLAGYLIIRVTWNQLRYRPDLVSRRIRRALSDANRGLFAG